MRRLFLLLVIASLGVAVLAIVGPELPEGNFLNSIGSGIRDVGRAVGESIGFSVKGFAG